MPGKSRHKGPGNRSQQTRADDPNVDTHWVCVGAFGGAHGVRGDVKLNSFTEHPEAIFGYGGLYAEPDFAALNLTKKHGQKAGFVVQVEGIGTREAATALKGKKLYIRRDQLPETEIDEYYVTDLEGLTALGPDGNKIGVINGVHDYGAGHVLDLLLDEPRKGYGRTPMVPFSHEYVGTVDIRAGSVVVMLDHWLGDQQAVTGDGPKGEGDDK